MQFYVAHVITYWKYKEKMYWQRFIQTGDDFYYARYVEAQNMYLGARS